MQLTGNVMFSITFKCSVLIRQRHMSSEFFAYVVYFFWRCVVYFFNILSKLFSHVLIYCLVFVISWLWFIWSCVVSLLYNKLWEHLVYNVTMRCVSFGATYVTYFVQHVKSDLSSRCSGKIRALVNRKMTEPSALIGIELLEDTKLQWVLLTVQVRLFTHPNSLTLIYMKYLV